jgi:hypothetical protein
VHLKKYRQTKLPKIQKQEFPKNKIKKRKKKLNHCVFKSIKVRTKIKMCVCRNFNVAQKLLTFELSVNINLRMRVGSGFFS